jgi:hypothetical protein
MALLCHRGELVGVGGEEPREIEQQERPGYSEKRSSFQGSALLL